MNNSIINEFNNLIYQINYILVNFDLSDKEKTREEYRLKSLTTSLNIIKNFNKPLKDNQNIIELSNLKGIGKGTIDRIKEINKSGKLSEIVINKNSQQYFNNLIKIYCIGPKYAFKLLKQGIKSIDELKTAIKNNKVKITNNIRLGIKYYDKLQENNKRSVIKKHKIILKSALDKVIKDYNLLKTDLFIKLCGSYRRKKDSINDIDCLLVINSDKIKNRNWLNIYVNELKKINYIVDSFTNKQQEKYMGFVKNINDTVLRLDIQKIDHKRYPFALLYFTGNKYFNLFIRNKAKEKGYKLNEFGLFKNNKQIQKEIKTEKDIFEFLDLKYLKPSERNF